MKVKINREDGAFEYAQAVLNGDINACFSVKKNCETFIDLWRAVESGVITDIRYNNSTLDKFYLVSKGLRHFEGQTRYLGKSIEWQLWQRYFFGNVYGWEVFDNELQEWVWLHKEIFLFCAKKQGKSFMSSGISIFDCGYVLDAGAKCYIFGVDANTAKIPYENCIKFIESDEDLSEDFSVVGTHIYTNWDRSSYIQLIPKMSKAGNFDGKNVFSAVCEEVHTFEDNGNTYDIFSRGVSARSNSHIVSITTAGYNKYSFCKQQYDFYKKITEKGDFYSPQWGLIYELDKDDDWRDESVWIKSNPNLGVSKRVKHMRDQIKKIDEQPTNLNKFLAKDLNVWVDNVEAWLDSAKLELLFKPFDIETLKGKKCFLGLDLARKRDLSAVVAVFPSQDGIEVPIVYGHFFIDESTCDIREELSKVPFRQWSRSGWITLTEGDEINFEEIESWIKSFAKKYNVQALYYDPTFAGLLISNLSNFGIETREFRQNGKSYSDVISAAEQSVNKEKILFVENEALRWCIYNVQIQTFSDNRVMPYKRGDENKKIDGAVAWLMAFKGLVSKSDEERKNAARAYLIAKGYTFDENGKPVKMILGEKT